MSNVSSLLENSKSNMMDMLKNKKYSLAIFLFLVIILVVFALALNVNTTLNMVSANANAMIRNFEELGGTQIGGINRSNATTDIY